MNAVALPVDDIARHLDDAALQRREVTKVTDANPGMTVADGYDVQYALRKRMAGRGARLTGMKMGLTSHAKMRQMGIDTPIYGFLVDTYAVGDGGVVDTSKLIHPKVEAEIAFVTKAALSGPDCDEAMVMAATDFLLPAVELIDSRYENFRFDLPSVVADNTSAAHYAVGSQATPADGLDLATLGVVLEKNGKVLEVGAGAAVLGNPATAVAMLVNMLAERGESLPAGSLVLSGAVTAAIAVAPGDNILVRAQHLGTVALRFS